MQKAGDTTLPTTPCVPTTTLKPSRYMRPSRSSRRSAAAPRPANGSKTVPRGSAPSESGSRQLHSATTRRARENPASPTNSDAQVTPTRNLMADVNAASDNGHVGTADESVSDLEGADVPSDEPVDDAQVDTTEPPDFPTDQPIINNPFTNHDESLYDQGYDSEGNLCYLEHVFEDESEDEKFEEDPLETYDKEKEAEEEATPVATIVQSPSPQRIGPWSEDEFLSFGQNQLKAFLKDRGMPVYGTKAILRARLREAVGAPPPPIIRQLQLPPRRTELELAEDLRRP